MNEEFVGPVVGFAIGVSLIVAVVAAFAIVSESRSPQPVLLVEIVELPGDRFVECVRPLSARGVTCNWEAADAD